MPGNELIETIFDQPMLLTIVILGGVSVCLFLTILCIMKIKFSGLKEQRANEKVYAIETFSPDVVGYPKVPISR